MAPVATTLNRACWPTVTVSLAGWVVMVGAPVTVPALELLELLELELLLLELCELLLLELLLELWELELLELLELLDELWELELLRLLELLELLLELPGLLELLDPPLLLELLELLEELDELGLSVPFVDVLEPDPPLLSLPPHPARIAALISDTRTLDCRFFMVYSRSFQGPV